MGWPIHGAPKDCGRLRSVIGNLLHMHALMARRKVGPFLHSQYIHIRETSLSQPSHIDNPRLPNLYLELRLYGTWEFSMLWVPPRPPLRWNNQKRLSNNQNWWSSKANQGWNMIFFWIHTTEHEQTCIRQNQTVFRFLNIIFIPTSDKIWLHSNGVQKCNRWSRTKYQRNYGCNYE